MGNFLKFLISPVKCVVFSIFSITPRLREAKKRLKHSDSRDAGGFLGHQSLIFDRCCVSGAENLVMASGGGVVEWGGRRGGERRVMKMEDGNRNEVNERNRVKEDGRARVRKSERERQSTQVAHTWCTVVREVRFLSTIFQFYGSGKLFVLPSPYLLTNAFL